MLFLRPFSGYKILGSTEFPASMDSSPKLLNGLLFNKGELKRPEDVKATDVKVIVIQAGFGDATVIEVTDSNSKFSQMTIYSWYS